MAIVASTFGGKAVPEPKAVALGQDNSTIGVDQDALTWCCPLQV